MASSRRRRHAPGPPTKRRKTTESTTCRVTPPDGLVVEVLLRLPARSLARLRCVCRSWDAEISSCGFQQRHHDLAAAYKFAFLPMAARSHSAFFQVFAGGARPAQQVADCKYCPGLIGSKPCRGLVLVKRPCAAEGGYSVCNLTTGEILPLPLSHHRHAVIGIGFHAAAGEFKVVQVDVEPGKPRGRVLTIGDARGWRAPAASISNVVQASFDDFTEDTTLFKHVQPVFADGCLHWSFMTSDMHVDQPHGVLSFSLADESFRRLPHPPFSTAVDLVPYDYHDLSHEHVDKIFKCGLHGVIIRSSDSGGQQQEQQVHVPVGQTLAELDGRLCMVRDVRHRRGDGVGCSLFEIWKVQDYEAGSWSLDYRIDMSTPGRMAERLTKPWLVLPLRYLDGGGGGPGEKRKLLLATTAQEAHVYDPDSGTLRTVASVAIGGNTDDSVRLVLYQESLFRFAGMKQGKRKIKFVHLDSTCRI